MFQVGVPPPPVCPQGLPGLLQVKAMTTATTMPTTTMPTTATTTTSTTTTSTATSTSRGAHPDPAIEAELSRLLKAGEHAAAAAAMRFHGQEARAAAIYESLFEYGAALQCFEAAFDLVAAVRIAIAMGDMSALHRLVGDAIARGQGDALIGALHKANRFVEVGRVYVARGEPVAAATAFEQGEAWSDAARCHEDLGQIREAGLLLERWLDRHPEDDGAAIRLGRILARFGRHDDAIALLQKACRSGADRDLVYCRAAPTMALAFMALGYEEAARAVVTAWRTHHDKARARSASSLESLEVPPQTLEALLSSARAAAFSAVQETSQAPRSQPPGPAARSSSVPSSSPPVAVGFDDLFGDQPKSQGSADATPTNGPAVDDGADDAERRLLLNGRYLLGEPLGGGGVGQVFRAYDAFSDRAVAVKIFGAQVLTSDAVTSWAREVRAAASLSHPALVKLVELNMAQGFVVTELHGEDDGAVLLEERLRRGSDGGWLLPTLVAVLDALSACHRTGLVHGGLKPRNVFVVRGGVKLLDMGAHRLLSLRATETGGLASVWPYLSPELLFGAPADVDGDLYATAAMAYRALVGVPPFAAASADRRAPPPRADVVRPEVPAAWADFLERALNPDRSKRFADADEMRQALPRTPPQSLPRAVPLEAEKVSDAEQTLTDGGDRYVKGALVDKQGPVRTYEAQDALVARPVWLVEVDAAALEAPVDGVAVDSPFANNPLGVFVEAARLWRGVQPVYDIVLDERGRVRQVILARKASRHMADFADLRRVPQGLSRDLTAIAEALMALHTGGVAVGGFDTARATGPIGPRLRLAPAPLLVGATDDAIAADWHSFGALVAAAFDAPEDDTLDDRGKLLAALHNGRFLERHDLEALARERDAPWPRFLEQVADQLVRGAQGRTVAKLVASVVYGRETGR
jgi:tetratricopeptide (TPR) repeat protein